MKEKIERFVLEMNQLLPRKEDILESIRSTEIKAAFSDNYFDNNAIRILPTPVKCLNEIEHLILNTNISEIGIGAVNFRSKLVQITDELIGFGKVNDSEDICYEKDDPQRIVAFDQEFEEKHEICRDFNSFLNFLKLSRVYDNFKFFSIQLNNTYQFSVDKLLEEGFSQKWVREFLLY